MSNVPHTPGPWSVEDPLGSELLHIVQAGKPTHEWRLIAAVSVEEAGADEIPVKEAQANARLIAAAPDLLAAGKALRRAQKEAMHPSNQGWAKWQGQIKEALADLDAAIAKAEGRSDG